MASIPASVIFVWTGTNATIPSGWSRETTLDDKHAKAWGAENPNTTGGAATHTHTSPTHTHTVAAHTHTHSSSTVTPPGAGTDGTGGGLIQAHYHNGTSGASSGGTTSADAVTYGSVSNDPPCRTVIFVKASVGAQLATNIVALYNSNTPPSNWSNVTELSGRYMKGAGTGADADLTTDSGSSTNSHGITHTHASVGTHAQATSTSDGGTGSSSSSGAYVDPYTAQAHTHQVSWAASTQNLNQNTDTLVTTETVEPTYAILQAIKKGASGIKTVGIIGLWLGTVASIPKGWIVCDGTNSTKDLRDRFIKIGDPAGANGGANTHTHAAQAHTHTGSGTHTHTGTADAHTNTTNRGSGPQSTPAVNAASGTHTITSVQAVTANSTATNTTADSSANQPSYRTAAYIQFQKEISNGTFLLSLM